MIDKKTLKEISKRKVFKDSRDIVNTDKCISNKKCSTVKEINKNTVSPKEIISVLIAIGATINNDVLSEYFSKKGIDISPNSIRSIKANLSRL